MVPLGKASNQYIAFLLSEKGNKLRLTMSRSTFLIRIVPHILVKVLTCIPSSSVAKPPN
jgi:hypothetical protein